MKMITFVLLKRSLTVYGQFGKPSPLDPQFTNRDK